MFKKIKTFVKSRIVPAIILFLIRRVEGKDKVRTIVLAEPAEFIFVLRDQLQNCVGVIFLTGEERKRFLGINWQIKYRQDEQPKEQGKKK